MPLTNVELRNLKPGSRAYKRADERGLYIEVRPGGSKLWCLKYRHAGKEKRLALGVYPEVGLAEARRKRDEPRQQIRDVDPSAERQREKLTAQFSAANTFGEIAKEYIDKMVAEGRAVATTSKANWLLEQLAPISRRPIAELTPVEHRPRHPIAKIGCPPCRKRSPRRSRVL
ncbi:Arm DNA-binding domain-containing protein [Pelagerythrobacter rhizovicinus]|uniref:DUF4102 domain-containing protein n=1 Tax=Pelagerythrobacter rhizovicinus TaxID=2268576 RepID=A0A4Q2KL90_9SPHN|nr:Arm DNA-binding domain-containing protein [Pelagerythrobacter rhizovicinus]RXZ65199.1 DUF4102 domain-containing protein [Pelagerythrobacter rhizovicinus]